MRVGFAVVLACALWLGPSAAFAANPLDDDAGSGGDAGDLRELAVPIGPGTHTGRLGTPHDIWDQYVFEGVAGQVAHVTFEADGYAVVDVDNLGSATSGETLEVLLPWDGPTYLTVATLFVVLAPSVDPTIPYAFTLEFVAPSSAAWRVSEGPALAAEAVWAIPGTTTITAQASLAFQPEEPASVMIVLEWSGVDEPYAAAIHEFQSSMIGGTFGSGFGNRVVVAPGALPVVALPAVTTNQTSITATVTLGPTGLHWVRMAIHATVPARLTFTALSSAPFEHRFGSAVEAFTWDERNSGAEVQVLAPGVSVTPPRALDRELDDRSIVFMDTAGWDGTITDPAGRTTNLGLQDPIGFVVFPAQHGTWSFGLGPTAGAGFGAVHTYLHEVRVPSLGLAPDVTRA